MHDAIIVGAGTAGCVLAERLTSSGRLKVALVEAGGPPTNRFVPVPAGFAKLFKSEVDWNFESEPQTAVGGRRIFTPRGKMLGGSANMNAQVHQWCHPDDFDQWAEGGAAGWSWKDVEPVFRAQENWLGNDGDPLRGRSGPMLISPNRNARSLSHAFVAAVHALGLGRQPTYNASAYEGAWICELAHKNGKRFSVYDAYLKPAAQRPNLEIISGAHVTGLIIEDNCARGVTLRRGTTEESLRSGAVVLAAGAFGSPQLLLLSGIGPHGELSSHGITMKSEAPEVGLNLQDHPVLGLRFRTNTKDTLKSAESPLNLLRYLVLKSGMLASNGVEAFAFTRVGPGPGSAPDLELMFLPFENRNQFLDPPLEHCFSIAPAVVAPRSRGRLTLRSADPTATPHIDFGLLSDPGGIDKAVLLAGMRLSRRIAATAPLAALNSGESLPGAQAQTDDELLAHAHSDLQTVYHPSCTCRMGLDGRSVVDPYLRLRGVERLWIADASVMPTVPRGHPNAVVAMIAERAAGWIYKAMAQ